jgi:hypothetical protein
MLRTGMSLNLLLVNVPFLPSEKEKRRVPIVWERAGDRLPFSSSVAHSCGASPAVSRHDVHAHRNAQLISAV